MLVSSRVIVDVSQAANIHEHFDNIQNSEKNLYYKSDIRIVTSCVIYGHALLRSTS